MELFDVSQWIIWKNVGGRKLPMNESMEAISVTDPKSYTTYAQAMSNYDALPVDGPAFVFTPNDPYGGIDFDNCLTNEGILKPWCQPIINRFAGTYIEVSPSQLGLKVFGKFVKAPNTPCVTSVGDGQIEIYDRGRFFTFTGQAFAPYSAKVIDNLQARVEWLLKEFYQPQTEPLVHSGSATASLRIRASAYVAGCDLPGAGGRNNVAFKLAGHLMSFRDDDDSLNSDDVMEFLVQWNSHLSLPLSERELRRCILSAEKSTTAPAPKHRNDPEPVDMSVFLRSLVDGEPRPADETFDIPYDESETVVPSVSYKTSAKKASMVSSFGEWRDCWSRREPRQYLDCGFRDFQIAHKELVVIGGGPGTGKSTIAMQLLTDVLINHPEERLLICSVEMPPEDLIDRLVARGAGVDYQKVFNRKDMTEEQWTAVDDYAAILQNRVAPRMECMPRPFTMQDVICLAIKHSSTIILLDYLQRIDPLQNWKGDPFSTINHTMDAARFLCDWGMAVMAISSLNRPKEKEEGYKQPTLTSLRGSSELEYGPNEAWGLTREEDESEYLTLHHLKGRNRSLKDIQCEQFPTLEIRDYRTMKIMEPTAAEIEASKTLESFNEHDMF